jgi:large subunit ribosomal protein L6
MSRIGKLPVQVPDNIKVAVANDVISFDSGKMKKSYKVSTGVQIDFDGKLIKFSAKNKAVSGISMFVGMDRSNVKNIVQGLKEPFKIILEINGVGYKAAVEKSLLFLTIGYSHEVVYALPAGITAAFEKPNLITLTGADKVLVGQVASEIISFRKPEPYKGKGIKIFGKKILRKEGKKK